MRDVLSTLTRDVLFGPLDTPGRTEAVINRLRTAVALGVLADGAQLPSEVDLAAQFNVAPGTLREALSALREEGIVETRRGRGGGSFVRVPESLHVTHASALLSSMPPPEFRDLSDWRAAVAGASAQLAAERASDQDVGHLGSLAGSLAAAEDEATARRFDARFHIALAAAAQSRRLSTEAINLQVTYAPMLALVYADPEVRREGGARLAEVADCVRAGEAERARRVVTELTTDTARRLSRLRGRTAGAPGAGTEREEAR
ncbi:FadR/GntR family transcriptional regulator [Geodermatophilus normandii]|uniref:FadR family transcriptional regulator n=1 Tax=Geodermatophilus normandii TaxID=1137989 RepID=A0A6P0GF20_9ACTN|nr:GntR family transcriptional regulator [Geodermatophilus normandii]NEM05863.1 FadR family transcriptional regulator [Geodermatophilus normandii]